MHENDREEWITSGLGHSWDERGRKGMDGVAAGTV